MHSKFLMSCRLYYKGLIEGLIDGILNEDFDPVHIGIYYEVLFFPKDTMFNSTCILLMARMGS